jgi:hypothetical protein
MNDYNHNLFFYISLAAAPLNYAPVDSRTKMWGFKRGPPTVQAQGKVGEGLPTKKRAG